MAFLDNSVCCSTTVGDLFKLFVPVVWTIISFCAVVAYLCAPLSRGDSPRWGSASLVFFGTLAGLGLSAAVYSFHRTTSACSVEWTNEQRQSRSLRLSIHACVAAVFSLLGIALVVFFAVPAFASEMGRCAHETCGADVGWSAISLAASLPWLGLAYLGKRELSRTSQAISDNNNDDEDLDCIELPGNA